VTDDQPPPPISARDWAAKDLHRDRDPGAWFDLGSDDAVPAGEHVDTACAALRWAAAEIDDAYRLANAAFNALSHLKLAE